MKADKIKDAITSGKMAMPKITISGPQGCGKTTIAESVKNALAKEGYRRVIVEEVQTK